MKWLGLFKRLSREARILLFIHGLYSSSTALSNLFIGIYLWRIDNDYITVATYYLMLFIFSTTAFAVSGWILTKLGRSSVYRIGLLLHFLFFAILLIIKEKAAFYPIELGIIHGVALGFYWLSLNVLIYDSTKQEDRSFFYGINGFLTSTAGVLGPTVAGATMGLFEGLTGYFIIFAVSLSLYIFIGIFSYQLENQHSTNRYKLKKLLEPSGWNEKWRRVLASSFMFGTREGIFMFIINLLFYIATASEVKLGWFNSLCSILGMCAFYLVGRLVRQKNRSRFLFIGVFGLFLSSLVLIYDINFYSLLLFGIMNAIFTPYLIVPYSAIGLDVIDQNPESGQLRTEYIVVREIAINLGRVIPVLLFIFLYNEKDIVLLKYFLIIPSLALLSVWWYLRNIDTSAGNFN